MKHDDVLPLLTNHIHTGYLERDDDAHLGTLAPDAYLIVGDRAIKRADIDPAEVLAAWSQAADVPQLGLPEDVSWLPEGPDRGMATAMLPGQNGQRLRAAFGLTRHDDDWRVSWSCLVEGDLRDPDRQKLAALAEMTTLDAVLPLGSPRTLLELGYLRLHALPEIPLFYLPETRFSCQGSTACCTHPMTIGIDSNSATFIEEVNWQSLDPQLTGPFLHPIAPASPMAFDHMLKRDDAGRCRFLTADSRCSVHNLVGRPVFKPCHIFPYSFAWCPDGVCVTVHHMCPSARFGRGAHPDDRKADIRSRLAIAGPLRSDTYRLLSTVEVGWPAFRDIEERLLDLLEGDRPLRRKLWAALCWLEARLREPDPPILEAWYDLDPPTLATSEWESFEDFVALFDPYFRGLERAGAGTDTLEAYDPVLSRWFRSLLFGKGFTYAHGLVGGMIDLVLVLRILERQFRLYGNPGVSETFWRDFFGIVATHKGNFRKYLSYCHSQPDYVLHRLGDNPRFGLNLLLEVDPISS